MHIDFTQVTSKEMKLSDLAGQLNAADLRTASNESVDRILGLLDGLTDADVVFEPTDPEAKDDAAVEGEETIAWSFAHLIAHVTSSSEEGAAFSSMLARGFPAAERPRHETPWRDITTIEQCKQRLEESRRMRLAYLDTWPDEPHLDVVRQGMSERFEAFTGQLNAIGAFLLGLWHEIGHYAQMEDVRGQSLNGR